MWSGYPTGTFLRLLAMRTLSSLRPVIAAQAALKRSFDPMQLLYKMWKRYAEESSITVYTQSGFDDNMLLERLLRSMYNEATEFEILYFEEQLKDKNL